MMPDTNISIGLEPLAFKVHFTVNDLVVQLRDGRSISVPLEWFPKLRDATAEKQKNWRLIGRGVGINWEELDEDISVRGLLSPEV